MFCLHVYLYEGVGIPPELESQKIVTEHPYSHQEESNLDPAEEQSVQLSNLSSLKKLSSKAVEQGNLTTQSTN